jgi:hypothetical protein
MFVKNVVPVVTLWIILLSCCALSAQKFLAQNPDHRVRNTVLVHGASADGSGWKRVYEILLKDGFNVSIVQEPETSFQNDGAATKSILALQDGPCILVAHSYGGAVLTEGERIRMSPSKTHYKAGEMAGNRKMRQPFA